MQEYADPVIDWLDAGRGILGRRLFREVSPLLLSSMRIASSHRIAIAEVLTDGSRRFSSPTVVHPAAQWELHQGPIDNRAGSLPGVSRR